MAVNASDLDSAWGRKWHIAFIPANGGQAITLTSDEFGIYAPHATFRIERPGYQAIMFAEVTVWNLNAQTINSIIPPTQGFSPAVGTIVIQAGYQNGNYGRIFTGEVFQTRVMHENAIDNKLILNCIDGLSLIYGNNYASLTFAAGVDQQAVVQGVANQAVTPIPLGTLMANLQSKQLPRGKVIFADPSKVFRDIAQDNNSQFWFSDGQMNIVSYCNVPPGQSLIIYLPPIGGLIGYPEQVDAGVQFKVLMNPSIVLAWPPMDITFDSKVQINEQEVQYGSQQLPYILSSGSYKVVKVSHYGDTRGNDWYTEALAMTPQGALPYLLDKSPN